MQWTLVLPYMPDVTFICHVDHLVTDHVYVFQLDVEEWVRFDTTTVIPLHHTIDFHAVPNNIMATDGLSSPFGTIMCDKTTFDGTDYNIAIINYNNDCSKRVWVLISPAKMTQLICFHSNGSYSLVGKIV